MKIVSGSKLAPTMRSKGVLAFWGWGDKEGDSQGGEKVGGGWGHS